MQRLTAQGSNGAVCTVDYRASQAGVDVLNDGGNAVDAAIAANAVLTVVSQHMCGMGGDLFALVHLGEEEPACLNASGWAGAGADPDRLRSEGHLSMPFKGDIRSTPVPGCVDGWFALAERFGTVPLDRLLEAAHRISAEGFEIPDHLVQSSARVAGVTEADDYQNLVEGALLKRPATAAVLDDIRTRGRDGFYLGRFGQSLLELGAGEFSPNDMEHHHAEWVDPLNLDAWGHRIWTVPPNSQGYLTLASAGIADGLDLPTIDDDLWVHLLVESARHASYDRIDSLYDGADGFALIAPERLAARRANISGDRTASLGDTYSGEGTIHMVTTDANGGGVSLINSNAAGFGVNLVVPGTGIFLQNRGSGFNLTPGHPAEYQPGRRAPHTLAPALVTHADGSLRTVLGTMGGDAQPQIMLQMLARLLHNGQSPGEVLGAPRWILEPPDSTGFDTWEIPDAPNVILEPAAPVEWVAGLETRGQKVEHRRVNVGHAHMIDLAGGIAHAATEPRISTSAALTP
ncbi:MAG: gamma-glutamyltransferase [Acidimicrobiia bacterium]|nr:gamma-glutamyltransferase [Acidimicrobiia bacterium]